MGNNDNQDGDVELGFYDKFFFDKDLEPYPVQEQAFSHIFRGENVFVSVPTGTGKTLIAKAAIYRALAAGRRAVYTTPLRALTEEKYRELCAEFGEANVGFATGDFKVNRGAPIQVEVAEILWNRIFGDRGVAPADVVVMDEAHYFSDFSRGHVWEQSIIGLHPDCQLVMLSATVGRPEQFCQWAELTRRIPMHLVESRERKVPLRHEYREEYLIETVRGLAAAQDVPAIIFVFGREKCFETARLFKSCKRFTSDEERAEINARCDAVLLDRGVSRELRSFLTHGIGLHHAGILPIYKQLVEELALERLIKFIVSTETISAGINLPAKRVVFPSLRKFIRRKARLMTPAEFHQMAGRAGRPQFDKEGVAIALAPEGVVQEYRKEVKDAGKRSRNVDEGKVLKACYARARTEAKRREDITWDFDAHQQLVRGEPAALVSRTQVTAEQVLTIGLPDLVSETLPGDLDDDALKSRGREIAYRELNIATVVDNLLLPDNERRQAQRTLAQVTANLRALGVVDDHGARINGDIIAELNGMDGVFVYYALRNYDFSYEECCQLVEFLVDNQVVQRVLDRKAIEARKAWIKTRLHEKRKDSPQISWEDVEAEYDEKFPVERSIVERLHSEMCDKIPNPHLHSGSPQNRVWQALEAADCGFFDFVEREKLDHEEGSLFSYLIRVLNYSTSLADATGLDGFRTLERRVRKILGAVDPRLASETP